MNATENTDFGNLDRLYL